MQVVANTDWRAHPDARLEQLISTSAPAGLEALLRQPTVSADRYAHLRVLDRLRRLQPGNSELCVAWAQAMLMSNRPVLVWEVAKAWPMDGSLDAAWILMAAQVAQVVGEREEARLRYRWLVEQHPQWVDAWQKYVEFEAPDQLTEDELAKVRALYSNPPDSYTHEKAAFALAGIISQTEPGKGFLLAEEAHQLKRKRLGSWSAAQVRQRLMHDRLWTPLVEDSGVAPRPLFVVGLPRSGTTLLTRMLGSHSRAAGLGEQNLIPSLAATVGRDPHQMDPRLPAFVQRWYRAAIGDIAGDAALVIDKLPANIEYIGLILAMFPDALIVHLERDLADCALSIYLRDFEFGCLYADSPEDLAHYATMIQTHWRYWQDRVPQRLFHLHYETLIKDPQTVLGPVLAGAGLVWEEQMLEFWRRDEQIATFSESQTRQPLNQKGIGRWRHSLPEAAEFFRTLGVDFEMDTSGSPTP